MSGTYVYGVTSAATQASLGSGGVEDRPVRKIERGPLAALVGDAPAGPIKATRRNLMAHSEVLQAAVAGGCVLPMRFGVVMPSDEAVSDELLGEREDVLREQLDALAEHVELELKVLCPEDVLLRSIVAGRPDIARARERLAGQPEDATYGERIALGEEIAHAVEARRADVVQRVVGGLEPLAASTEIDEPTHREMLVNAAFLVERAKLESFDAAVRKLDEELGPDLQLKYVGPLPPYHFVDTGSPAWA